MLAAGDTTRDKYVCMKYRLLFLLLLLTGSFCRAQNLVPNPSFEDFNYCPHYTDDRYAWQFWTSFGGTPDVFNICSDSIGGVPVNFPGKQIPATGNSYGGLIIVCADFNPWHEYLAVPFTDFLVEGVKYFVSIKVSLADCSSHASNNLGIGFSTDSFPQSSYTLLFNDTLTSYLKINSQAIITDSMNWTTISGSFTADSAYKYLVIGNFTGYRSTNTIALGNNCLYETAYYYIDDVCVTSDSTGCDFSTGTKYNSLSFNAYPNPASERVFISTDEYESLEYSLISLLGDRIKIVKSESYIDVSDVPAGVYILEIKYHNQTFLKKQFIIHNY